MNRRVVRLVEVLTRSYSHFANHNCPDAALLRTAAQWAAAGQPEAARIAIWASADSEYREFYGEEACLITNIIRTLDEAFLPEDLVEDEEAAS